MKSFNTDKLKQKISPFFDYDSANIKTKITVFHKGLTVENFGKITSATACFQPSTNQIWVSVKNVMEQPSPNNILTITEKIILLLVHELVHAFQYYTDNEFSEKQANDISCEICGNMWGCQLDWSTDKK